jgi:hypothetical protein
MERRKKVLCPVEKEGKKTYWMRVGSAWVNNDGSLSVWLNAYPANGKLQIRDLDASDIARMEGRELRKVEPQSDLAFSAPAEESVPF